MGLVVSMAYNPMDVINTYILLSLALNCCIWFWSFNCSFYNLHLKSYILISICVDGSKAVLLRFVVKLLHFLVWYYFNFPLYQSFPFFMPFLKFIHTFLVFNYLAIRSIALNFFFFFKCNFFINYLNYIRYGSQLSYHKFHCIKKSCFYRNAIFF